MNFQFLDVDNMDEDFILSSDTAFHLIGHAINDILYINDNFTLKAFFSRTKQC